MTKQEFVMAFKLMIEESKVTHISVYVQLPDLIKPECITNPRVNFIKKLEYYEKAYNDDMELNTFNQVKIVDLVGLCK